MNKQRLLLQPPIPELPLGRPLTLAILAWSRCVQTTRKGDPRFCSFASGWFRFFFRRGMTEWLSTRPNSNVNLLEATSAISRQNLWQRSSAFSDSEAIGGAAKVFHSLALIRQCFFLMAFIPGLKSCIKIVQLKSNTSFLVVDMNERGPKLKKAMACKYVSI